MGIRIIEHQEINQPIKKKGSSLLLPFRSKTTGFCTPTVFRNRTH